MRPPKVTLQKSLSMGATYTHCRFHFIGAVILHKGILSSPNWPQTTLKCDVTKSIDKLFSKDAQYSYLCTEPRI